MLKRDNRWKRVKEYVHYSVPGLAIGTGMYKAIVLEDGYQIKIKLIERLENGDMLPLLDFTIPSKKVPGTFVAMLHGKVVLPSATICSPGTYYALIMNDTGKYYRAWVL
jgi:hypothetical protein